MWRRGLQLCPAASEVKQRDWRLIKGDIAVLHMCTYPPAIIHSLHVHARMMNISFKGQSFSVVLVISRFCWWSLLAGRRGVVCVDQVGNRWESGWQRRTCQTGSSYHLLSVKIYQHICLNDRFNFTDCAICRQIWLWLLTVPVMTNPFMAKQFEIFWIKNCHFDVEFLVEASDE